MTISVRKGATTFVIAPNVFIQHPHTPPNSIRHSENLVGGSLVVCRKSYCNLTQNIWIKSIRILIGFQGDRNKFYFMKRWINIISIICNQDIKSYGAIFSKRAIWLFGIYIVFAIVFFNKSEFSRKYDSYKN